MRTFVFLSFFIVIFTNCESNKHELNPYESGNLKIEKLNKNLFKHVSYLDTEDYGKVACNGMIYVNGNEAVIIDSPANEQASKELINWIDKKNVKGIIATHFHVDCIGGLNEFHSNRIESYATNLTIQLVEEVSNVLPKKGFDEKIEIKVGNEMVIVQHFGQGHTKDNVVAYIKSEKVMFGGCLIKGLGAGKGNLEDANVLAWPTTVARIKKELPEIELIIPGHGKSGGKELLDYTIDLFSK